MFAKFFQDISKSDVAEAGGKGASLGEMTRLLQGYGGQARANPIPPGFVVLACAFEEFISTPLSFPPRRSGRDKLRRELEKQNKQKQTVIASRAERGVAISLEERNEIASQSLAMTIGESIDEFLKTVNKDDIKSVEKASEKIRGLILDVEMPSKISQQVIEAYRHLDTKFVAVRSSATSEDSSSAAWAGQLESYLNTTEETLLENVKKCWSSLFTPRAIFYRFEKFGNSLTPSRSESGHPSPEGTHKNLLSRGGSTLRGRVDQGGGVSGFISVAVVVQKMIQSEISGTAFSVHPVTQDRNQMIIEAGYGLGEAIVSGQITPDNYIVGKHQIPNPKLQTNSNDQNSKNKIKTSLRGSVKQSSVFILDKNIVTQEKMLIRSFSLSLREGGRRSLPRRRVKAGNLIQTRQPVIAPAKSRNDVNEWVPVPQQDQNKQKLSDSEILELSELILKIESHYGFPVDVEFAREHGKFYIVQSRPVTTLDNDFFSQVNISSQIKKIEFGAREYVMPLFWLTLPQVKIFNTDIAIFSHHNVSEYYYLNDSPKNLGNWGFRFFSNKDALERYKKEVAEATNRTRSLVREMRRINFSNISSERLARLFQGFVKDAIFFQRIYTRTEPVSLARFERSIGERQTKIIEIIARLRFKMRKLFEPLGSLFEQLFTALAERFDVSVDEIFLYTNKEVELLISHQVRVNITEIEDRKRGYAVYIIEGNRHLLTGDLYKTLLRSIEEHEILEFQDKLDGVVACRGFVRGKVGLVLHNRRDISLLVKKFKKGDVLVTEMTRPDTVMACRKASAIVTDEGSLTSHAAILSRELRIPCIVGTKIATKVLKDGDLVQVDADKGVVKILKRAK